MTAEEYSAVVLSVSVGLVAVLISLPFALVIGYGLARWRFPGKLLVQGFVDLPLVLPPVVTGYLLLILFAPTGAVGNFLSGIGIQVSFTWLGAAIASAVVSFPLMVRSIRSAFYSVDTRYELTARSLGASRAKTFFTVSLPLARHGVIAGCLLAFARSIGEFGATIMLAGDIPGSTRTIPLAIFSMGQRVDGFERSWRLVLLSILLAIFALFVGELMDKGRRTHDQD